MANKFWMTLGVAAVLGLGGCSTLSTVGDAVGSINPFGGGDDDSAQGDVGGQDERISLLSIEDTLSVTGDIAPQDVVLPASYVNADWPQAGGNLANAMQHTGASGPLNKAWSNDVGEGSSRKGRVVAPPVIAGGRLFIMDGDNKVTAVDANSGSEVWDHKIRVESKARTREGRDGVLERFRDPLGFTDKGGSDKESVGGGVAASDGRVYVSSGLGVVQALDAVSGELIWSKRMITPMHSAPKVAGGRLFVVSDDNELFALNAATGDVLWTYQAIIESARMLTAPSPAIVDDVVVAPFASGEIVALQAQNGNVLWQDSLSSAGRLTPLASLNDISAGPAVADGYVIATSQSGVMSAFDLRTGQRIWTQPAGSLGYPWIAGDFIYAVTTNAQVVCMSKISGSVVWMQQLQGFKNEKKRKERIAWAGPVMAGERLVTVSSRGEAVELNPYDGSIVRAFKVGEAVFVPPIIANETVYVLDDKARLTAYR